MTDLIPTIVNCWLYIGQILSQISLTVQDNFSISLNKKEAAIDLADNCNLGPQQAYSNIASRLSTVLSFS